MTPLQNAVPPLKTGLFGIGVDTYHNQRKGLKNRSALYIDFLTKQKGYIAETADIKLLLHNEEKAFKAGHKFYTTYLDLLYGTTFARSVTVLPVARLTGASAIV